MSLHKRREMASEKMNIQSMSTQNINGVKGTKTSSNESPSAVSEDHGVSDLSLLKILKNTTYFRINILKIDKVICWSTCARCSL